MSKLIDLTGQRFGKLTVLRRVENGRDGQSQWFCHCDCGVEKTVVGTSLRATWKEQALNRVTSLSNKQGCI